MCIVEVMSTAKHDFQVIFPCNGRRKRMHFPKKDALLEAPGTGGINPKRSGLEIRVTCTN